MNEDQEIQNIIYMAFQLINGSVNELSLLDEKEKVLQNKFCEDLAKALGAQIPDIKNMSDENQTQVLAAISGGVMLGLFAGKTDYFNRVYRQNEQNS